MNTTEQTVAKYLLDIEAVKLSPSKPFTWASGWKSPIYCDTRKSLSFPEIRKNMVNSIVTIIKNNFHDVEIIAGVATGGIAWGAIVADILGLPFVYVRSAPKDHGMGNQVEGIVPQGAGMVVIEDLVSTGKSSLEAAKALAKAGAIIKGMVALFSYNFDVSRNAFEMAGVELHTLSNYDTMIDIAKESGYIREEDVDTLRDWRVRPSVWGTEQHN
ncbi:MAG: orotate phosphoribosyltransferase [Alistipes sp.]|nr:orotate phosphoribosyltransferase [Candidatus Minthomonas equi]